jgi:hypothetical protein
VGAFFLIRFLINFLGEKVKGLEKEKKGTETSLVCPEITGQGSRPWQTNASPSRALGHHESRGI